MKKRIGIAVIAVVALLLLAAIGLMMLSANRTSGPMPMYQGKSAEYWLGQVFTSNQSQALQAFRGMGTNALPVLIYAFERKDSARDRLYQKIYSWMPRWAQSHLRKPAPAREDWGAAELVLLNLGRPIEPSPEFLRLLSYPNNPARAHMLEAIHLHLTPRDVDWAPALVNCLADTNIYLRFQAARALERLDFSAKAAVPALTALMNDKTMVSKGPSGWDWAFEARIAAAKAVWRIDGQIDGPEKVLREALNATNAHVRGWACLDLHQMKPGDASLIPLMTALLQGPDDGLRRTAAYVIRMYGPAAKEAVPALKNIISSSNDSDMRQRALGSLEKIDPAAAKEFEK
jgi:hypothetical protein